MGLRSHRRRRCLDHSAHDRLAAPVEAIVDLRLVAVEVLVRDDDVELPGLLAAAGFVADDERSGITWMDAKDRPALAALPEGIVVVTAPRTRPGHTRCGDETANRSRRACASACAWRMQTSGVV